MITRKECENAIETKLLEIWDVYKEYNPDGDFLSLAISNVTLSFNNKYWEEKRTIHRIKLREANDE